MLSKRAKYALKTLLFLHENTNDLPISAKKISETQQIPYKFLEQILGELKQNEILKSERGAEGGYSFQKQPQEIKIVEVLRIIDGPIAMVPCASVNFYKKCDDCHDEVSCHIRKLFISVRESALPILNKSIAELKNTEEF